MRYILLLVSILLLNSCALLEASQPWHPPLVIPADTATGQPTTVIYSKNFYAGSYKDRSDHRAQGGGTFVAKANAPVATGTSQAQDLTKAGQQGGAVSTAPGARAAATTRTGIPPWALVAGAGVLVVLSLLGLAYRYRAKLAGLFTPHL